MSFNFPICMLQSSAIIGWRPTTGTVSTGQEYDTGSSITVDTTTSATMEGPITATYSGVASSGGSRTGTLYIRVAYDTNNYGTVTNTANKTISYSIDGGTNYTTLLSTTGASAATTLSVGITLSDTSNLRVQMSAARNTGGSIPLGTDYDARGTITVYDIVFVG